MAKKSKKVLTASQKQRRYRVIQKASFGGEFLAMGTPYVIMGAINFDEWFKPAEGWKVGLGGSLALALMAIAVLSINSTKKEEDKKKGGYVKLLLTWLAIAFIFLLLANIMHQMSTIMFFGAIGIAGALGLDVTSKKYGNLADEYKEAKEEVHKESVKKEVEEEVKKEQEAEKGKVVF